MRITLPTVPGPGVFILEGRLTGLWAKELLRVARAVNQGYGNAFDLSEVFYVDSKGEEVLRWLSSRGAKFITESAYGKDVCNRLRLERVEACQVRRDCEETPQTSHKLRIRQPAGASGVGESGVADGDQHLPRLLQ